MLMVINMRASGKIIKEMVKEQCNMLMVINMWVSGKIIKEMVKEQ
jgi:hypothetical protein